MTDSKGMQRMGNWIKKIKQAPGRAIRFYKPLSWYYKFLLWFIMILLLHFLYLFGLIFVFPPITTTQLSNLLKGRGLNRDYVRLKNISAYAPLAVIGAEDQLFMEHYGFDMESIEKAMEHNKKKPKKTRGASTISQQVAKNVFLWQGRSWIRKGLEVYFTLMIETFWGKKRIMEMYLNVIEMGDGVFGIQAAAQQYFKKDAKNLSRTESAMIAAALPNPKRYKLNPVSSYVSFRLPWVLEQMDQLEPNEYILKLMRNANYNYTKGTPKKIVAIDSVYTNETNLPMIEPDSLK